MLGPRRCFALGVAALTIMTLGPIAAADAESLPKLSPMDWSVASAEDVDDLHAYRPRYSNGPNRSLAYYLAHFHRLANAVRDEEPNRGFIDLAVWRRPRDNEPYNARIMENITSLAWFYTVDEPWNPYHGDAALRQRLEAAMRFWGQMQHTDGRFSEYGEQRWNLAATAFATKFMAETLMLLENGPSIDPELHEQVRSSLRQALMRTFDGEDLTDLGRRFSNQYGNAFAGALAYLTLYEDEQMASALERQMRIAEQTFISPAGFMYEAHGPDWGYYFGTHHSNVHMAWHYGRHLETSDGGTFGDFVREEYARTTEWLAYNAVPQPDGERFMLNRAIESRTQRAALDRLETPLAEVVPLARAFSVSEEERQERLAWSREQLTEQWGDPPSLSVGAFSGFSPYAVLHRDHDLWHPTQAQQQAAREKLPYHASDRFVHQRVDDRRDQVYTYVRRPAYYLAFNSGPQHRNRQRRGIGLVWHPQHGTLLQSQAASTEFAWGTRQVGNGTLHEREDVDAVFRIDGERIEPEVGTRDLSDGELTIEYPIGGGERRLHFADDHIRVDITGRDEDGDAFVEQLPLLLDDGDTLEIDEDDRTVRLERDGQTILLITFEGSDALSLHEGDRVAGLTLTAVHARATRTLSYELRF